MLQIALEATYMGRPLYERYGFAKMEDEMELVDVYKRQPFGALNLIIGNFCDKQHVEKFPKQFLIIREPFNIIYSIKVP